MGTCLDAAGRAPLAGADQPALVPPRGLRPVTVRLEAKQSSIHVSEIRAPEGMTATFEDAARIDTRAILPLLRMPTLVLSHTESAFIPLGQGRYLADTIPGARHVELDGSDVWLFTDPRLIDHIVTFLGESSASPNGMTR